MHAPRILSTTAPALALGALALCLVPREAPSFTLSGSSLDLGQRHVRVFDNFTDPAAGDNSTPHSQFPGATRAPLAIWKAVVEWGSSLHGDGSGDPTQPFDLGSGGANFDAVWQGLATSVGNTNSNTHSEISGSGGGMLAFTEGPTSDGWRTRYYESVAWDDGPGAILAPAAVDLQGVATHEYGFALGLGNSSVAGATMAAALLGNGSELRSLAPDDIAGVQAVYGAAAASKPRIESWLRGGDTLTILGENFDAVGNEVWFTQAGPAGSGTPVRVPGLASTGGGTVLTLAVPAGAGPGDVLVKVAGSSGAALSNAFPFAPTCAVVAFGLELGGANVGRLTTPNFGVLGTTLQLQLSDFTGDAPGVVGFALGRSSLPVLGGTLLLNPLQPLFNLPVAVAAGAAQVPLFLPPDPTLDGARIDLQAFVLDGTAPDGFNLSGGLELYLCL